MFFNDEEEIKKRVKEDETSPKFELDENRTVDYMIIYSLASRFARKFENWEAYKLGLIDNEGNIIRSPQTLKEKSALTPLDRVILQIKRLIPKRLWYLLTAAYIFKGFVSSSTLKEVWDCETEAEIIEVEQKKLKMEEARKQIRGIIENNPHFTEEEFWQHVANKQND